MQKLKFDVFMSMYVNCHKGVAVIESKLQLNYINWQDFKP